MISSILTRITGTALLVSALLVTWWFLAAATSPEYFKLVNGILTCWVGDLVLLLSVWALWYHLLAGLRHLYWDTGRGLDVATADRLAWAAVIGSVLLTLVTALIL